MNIKRGKLLHLIPASHEDAQNPGSYKKILFKTFELTPRTYIAMINWALLPKESSFRTHYHEDMEEIFIIINGIVRIFIENEEEVLEAGDAVLVPIKARHKMINICGIDVNYIAIGLTLGQNGKTIFAQ